MRLSIFKKLKRCCFYFFYFASHKHQLLIILCSFPKQVNSFVSSFYDGVILYALAVNESLAGRDDPTNRKLITNRMWNRTFPGELFYTLSVFFNVLISFSFFQRYFLFFIFFNVILYSSFSSTFFY